MNSENDVPPYHQRRISFLEEWRNGDWVFKIYGLTPIDEQGHAAAITADLIDAAKAVAVRSMSESPRAADAQRVGYIIVHQGGGPNWITITWWRGWFVLYHELHEAKAAAPLDFVQPREGSVACVWELRIIEFERTAWVDHALRGEGIGAYLSARLNEDC